MVYKILIKKTSGGIVKNEIMSNKELTEDLHKTNIRTFEKRKEHSSSVDNIWGADLADMQLRSKFNKGISFLVFIIAMFSKHAWVIPSKDKKVITITNPFQKILDEPNRKPSKTWADKGIEFYNRSMKIWLEKNDIEMYSACNEGKSVVDGRFIKTLKNKIYKYRSSISKNVYIGKLDDVLINTTIHIIAKSK